VEGTVLGEKKISLLSFDLFLRAWKMKKRKRKSRGISKPSKLKSFANHTVHRR
jgi:hypothetical protein